MRSVFSCAVLALCLAAPVAQAQSLCGVTDEDTVLGQIAGDWDVVGAMAIDTHIVSFVEPFEATVEINDLGMVRLDMNGMRGDNIFVDADEGSFDVDEIDGFLEDTQAEWIADAVSATPCGPEGLLQLRDTSDNPDADYNRVTFIPYFADQMVMIVEVETQGEWGIAFISMTGLMTR